MVSNHSYQWQVCGRDGGYVGSVVLMVHGVSTSIIILLKKNLHLTSYRRRRGGGLEVRFPEMCTLLRICILGVKNWSVFAI